MRTDLLTSAKPVRSASALKADRLRAERRLGEMLIEQKGSGGLNTGAKGVGKSVVVRDDHTPVPTLADAGISKDLSSRAQKY